MGAAPAQLQPVPGRVTFYGGVEPMASEGQRPPTAKEIADAIQANKDREALETQQFAKKGCLFFVIWLPLSFVLSMLTAWIWPDGGDAFKAWMILFASVPIGMVLGLIITIIIMVQVNNKGRK